MSNLLEYNKFNNSPHEDDRNCNSPRNVSTGHYFFSPIRTSGSDNSSERSPITRPSINFRNKYRFFDFRKNSVVLAFMFIYVSVYLVSQVIQISPFISSHSHNIITSNSYAYNMLFSILISYFLFTFSNIRAKKISFIGLLIYWFSCTVGAISFALLGEVSFLKDIAITKGWLKRLSPAAFIVVAGFSIIIFCIGIKEYLTKNHFHDKCRSFLKISLLLIFYYSILFILESADATNIHYHVHHAICAGLMSLWFIDWDKYIELIIHGVFMGIVIEGIDFYGIQELFLFLSNDNSVSLKVAGFLYGGFTLFMFLVVGFLKKNLF